MAALLLFIGYPSPYGASRQMRSGNGTSRSARFLVCNNTSGDMRRVPVNVTARLT
jgi:hypothetical protein